MSGNDDDDDYHFANVGKYGSLTLDRLNVRGFNSAFNVAGTVTAKGSSFTNNLIKYLVVKGYGGAFRIFGGSLIATNCHFGANEADNISGHSTNDIYAVQSSYVELNNSGRPVAYLENSYLKTSNFWKSNIFMSGGYFEDAFEQGTEEVDFAAFNVSDDESLNALYGFLNNHSVSCLYINFTGDYDFYMTPYFDRNLAVIFNSNGFNVRLIDTFPGLLSIGPSSTMTFIGFNFDGYRFVNEGT